MEELSTRGHQKIFKRMVDYATDVTFHHIHIPIPLNMMINVVANTAMKKSGHTLKICTRST
jgi:hypothetical protein